ncbi:hypothetical protein D3C81_728930 [compost metagenome]
MKNTIRVSIVGPPHAGKSTLSQQVNLKLKVSGYSSAYIEEYVVDYITDVGNPTLFQHQAFIFEEQLKKEKRYDGLKDYIICDSASWTSYVYGRSLVDRNLNAHDIVAINQLHKKALETINYWDYIFYIPLLDNYVLDGVRYHSKKESILLSSKIKGWLEIENVCFTDLSDISLNDRVDLIYNTITSKNEVR